MGNVQDIPRMEDIRKKILVEEYNKDKKHITKNEYINSCIKNPRYNKVKMNVINEINNMQKWNKCGKSYTKNIRIYDFFGEQFRYEFAKCLKEEIENKGFEVVVDNHKTVIDTGEYGKTYETYRMYCSLNVSIPYDLKSSNKVYNEFYEEYNRIRKARNENYRANINTSFIRRI